MSSFHMFCVLVCAVLLATTDVALGRYSFQPNINGWVRLHKVAATWDDASRQCQAEGAVLMSPVREELLSTMLALSEDDTAYFIGTKARVQPGLYVSLEGVPLADMPVTYMFSQLDAQLGDCLSMDREHIRVVSCTTRLPYMCYREHRAGHNVTECGTLDTEYKLENSTGSCYKFHTVWKKWMNAYATCVAEGGYLAVVNNDAEAQTLVKIAHNKSSYVWIGLRDWNGNGDWTSVRGESLQEIYNTWEKDEVPANDCCEIGSIHPTTGLLSSFEQSQSTSVFICEKDPNYVTFLFEE